MSAQPVHPRHDLEPLLQHSVRLSVVAVLSGAPTMTFAYVRDAVQISDSVLSKQVTALEDAGFVAVSKKAVGRRPQTWLELTPDGRRMFDRHCDALQAIAAGVVPSVNAGVEAVVQP